MDLVTIRLDDLGTDCIVKNDKGDEFLALNKCRAAVVSKGWQDKWELKVCVQAQSETTADGKNKLSVFDVQSKEQRELKAKRVYCGGGIRLYEDNLNFTTKFESKGNSAPAPLPPM